MRLGTIIFSLLFLLQTIFAVEIAKEDVIPDMYSIKVGVFKKERSIQKAKKLFTALPVVIFPHHHLQHFYITNIKSREEAEALLRQKVKNYFKDAYILKNRTRRKPKHTTATVTIPTDKNSTVADITPKPQSHEQNMTQTSKVRVMTTTAHSDKKPLLSTPDNNRTITLKKAIMIALKRSHKILSLREKVIQQRYRVREKEGAFLPDVTLYSTAGYNYIHTRADKESEDKYPAADAQMSITENLYAGGKQYAELKKEQAKLRSESAAFRDKVEEETMKIIEAYIDLYYQKKAIEIERSNMQSLRKILHIVEVKEQNGASSKGDLNDIRSKVENASAALVKATSRYQNALAFYQYFLGKEGAKQKPSQGEFSFPDYSRKRVFEIFEKENAKLQINRYKIAAQKYDFDSRKAPFRPAVDLIITGKEKFSKAEIDPYHDEKASAVLSMRYNLYKGGSDYAKMMNSKSKIAELNYKYSDILESTRYNLKQLFENIQSLDDTLAHTQKEVEANQKAVEAYWNAFAYGTQDIVTLLLAQRALNRAQQDLLKDKKNYIITHFKLLAQCGELLSYLGISSFTDPDKM